MDSDSDSDNGRVETKEGLSSGGDPKGSKGFIHDFIQWKHSTPFVAAILNSVITLFSVWGSAFFLYDQLSIALDISAAFDISDNIAMILIGAIGLKELWKHFLLSLFAIKFLRSLKTFAYAYNAIFFPAFLCSVPIRELCKDLVIQGGVMMKSSLVDMIFQDLPMLLFPLWDFYDGGTLTYVHYVCIATNFISLVNHMLAVICSAYLKKKPILQTIGAGGGMARLKGGDVELGIGGGVVHHDMTFEEMQLAANNKIHSLEDMVNLLVGSKGSAEEIVEELEERVALLSSRVDKLVGARHKDLTGLSDEMKRLAMRLGEEIGQVAYQPDRGLIYGGENKKEAPPPTTPTNNSISSPRTPVIAPPTTPGANLKDQKGMKSSQNFFKEVKKDGDEPPPPPDDDESKSDSKPSSPLTSNTGIAPPPTMADKLKKNQAKSKRKKNK